MANEYMLSYTANEINEKLGKVGEPVSWNNLTDKPFYEEGEVVDILPEVTLTTSTAAEGMAILPDPIGLVLGEEYTVTWNGAKYNCVAIEVFLGAGVACVGLGNSGLIGGTDTGEPFGIVEIPPDVVPMWGFAVGIGTYGSASENKTFTVSVCRDNRVIHKLDNRYLDLDWLPIVKQHSSPLIAETTFGELQLTSDMLVGIDKVVVTADGVEYECAVSRDASGASNGELIGNTSLVNPTTPNTGEPFLIAVGSSFTSCIPTSISGSTVSIAVHTEAPNKLPAEFLPKGTPWIEENGVLMAEANATSITHPSFGKMWVVHGGTPNLTVGETYTITYNGVDYKCVCQAAPAGLIQDPNAVAMGNFVPVGGANTGEPFAMLVSYAYQEVDIIDLLGSASVKVGIKGAVGHKIAPECLPDGMLKLFNVKGTMDSGNVSVDKSFGEIYVNASNDNTVVRIMLQTNEGLLIGSLAALREDRADFTIPVFGLNNNPHSLYGVIVNADDTVEFKIST